MIEFNRTSLMATTLVTFVAVVSPHLAAQEMITAVAISGQQASGLPAGVNYNTLVSFQMNAAGQVMLNATVAGTEITTANDGGLWLGTQGNLMLAAREGGTLAGLQAGDSIGSPRIAMLNDAGELVVAATIIGTEVTPGADTAIWTGALGELTLKVREGDAAPGMPIGTLFDSLTITDSRSSLMKHNAAGQFLFFAGLTGPAITPGLNDRAVWLAGPNELKIIARQGDAAPGLPAGITFGPRIGNDTYALDAAGRILFGANLSGPGVTAANDAGIWLADKDGTRLIAREGQAAPGANVDARFSFTTEDNSVVVVKPVFASNGEIAFHAKLVGPGITSDTNDGIWLGPPDHLALLVRDGDPSPGDGRPFINFGDPQVNAMGKMAFTGVVMAPGSNSSMDGMWGGYPDDLRLILGGDSQDSQDSFDSFSIPQINASGEIAFSSRIRSPDGSTGAFGTYGVWLDSSESISLIARGGDTLAGKAVDSALNASRFNKFGQIAFRANFDGGGSGVFIFGPPVVVPEPNALVLAFLAVISPALGRNIARKRT